MISIGRSLPLILLVAISGCASTPPEQLPAGRAGGSDASTAPASSASPPRPAVLSNVDRQTAWLPDVDSVQVYEMQSPKADGADAAPDVDALPPPEAPDPATSFPLRPYGGDARAPIHRYRTLNGEDAKMFAAMWRAVEFDRGNQMLCHFPAYAFRCFSGGKMVFETSICWACSNFYVRSADDYNWHGFRSGDPNAKALYLHCERLFAGGQALKPDNGILSGEPPVYAMDPLEAYEAKEGAATDADLAALAGMTGIRSLDVRSRAITAEGLAILATFPNLESLDFSDSAVTDHGLLHLRHLKKLQRLDLQDTAITDRGLSHLSAFTSLHTLYLGRGVGAGRIVARDGITDAGLLHLQNLKALDELTLRSTAVTGAGLRHLAALPALRSLWLDDTSVGNKGLEALQQFPALEALHLDGTAVTDEGLRQVAHCGRLDRLTLEGTAITDAGVAHLADMPALAYLNLRGTLITNAAVQYLKRIPKLQSIWLGKTGLSDRDIKQLEKALPKVVVQH